VETGDVWLTQSDDTCDYTLAAGESLVLRRSGVALVQSRAGAVVGIAVPRLSRTPRMRVVRKLEDVAAGHSVFKPFVDRTL
jgi:hypothetical protein